MVIYTWSPKTEGHWECIERDAYWHRFLCYCPTCFKIQQMIHQSETLSSIIAEDHECFNLTKHRNQHQQEWMEGIRKVGLNKLQHYFFIQYHHRIISMYELINKKQQIFLSTDLLSVNPCWKRTAPFVALGFLRPWGMRCKLRIYPSGVWAQCSSQG